MNRVSSYSTGDFVEFLGSMMSVMISVLSDTAPHFLNFRDPTGEMPFIG
jgi:hypothetical protein